MRWAWPGGARDTLRMQARPSEIRRWSQHSLQGGLWGRSKAVFPGGVALELGLGGGAAEITAPSAEQTASEAFNGSAGVGFWGAGVPAFLPSGGVGHSLSFPPQGQGWWEFMGMVRGRAPWLGEGFGGAGEVAWAKGGAGSSNSKGLGKSGGHLEKEWGQDCNGGEERAGVRLASVGSPAGGGVRAGRSFGGHGSPLRR